MAVLWIKIREGAIARVVYHRFHTACFTPHHYDPSDSLSVPILTVDIYMSFSHKCTLTDSPDCAKRPSHHIFERVSGRTLRGEPYGCYGAYSPNTVGPIIAVAPPSPPTASLIPLNRHQIGRAS